MHRAQLTLHGTDLSLQRAEFSLFGAQLALLRAKIALLFSQLLHAREGVLRLLHERGVVDDVGLAVALEEDSGALVILEAVAVQLTVVHGAVAALAADGVVAAVEDHHVVVAGLESRERAARP